MRQQLTDLQQTAASMQQVYPLLRHHEALFANTPLAILMIIVAACCSYGTADLTDKRPPLLSVSGYCLFTLFLLSFWLQLAALNVDLFLEFDLPLFLCFLLICGQDTNGFLLLGNLNKPHRTTPLVYKAASDASPLFIGPSPIKKQPMPQVNKAVFLTIAV
jgi:hypothetical protein